MVRLFFELRLTQVNRQGTYVGIQYRSEIFYANNEEKEIAEKVLDEMNKKLDGKVSTRKFQKKKIIVKLKVTIKSMKKISL